MNGLPYYKRYPRDFIEGTLTMPFEHKGAYAIILDMIYMQGGKLPDDARYISGVLGVSVRKWKSIRNALIGYGKLTISGEFLTNYRSDKETEMLRSFQDKQSENASQPRKNNDLIKAVAKPKPSQPEPEPDIEKREAKASPKKKASRLSEGWVLPMDWGEWAVSQGWAETTVRTEAEKFRDFWVSKPGKDGTKLDWKATWRNWMRNSKTPKVIHGDEYGKPSDGSERLQRIVTAAAAGSSQKDWG